MVNAVQKPFQLLIADDNRAFREVLREALEIAPSLEFFEAESGEEAVEVVQRQRIDIVLLDMHMHVMTGLETLRVLKRMDAIRPCILITSDTSDALRRDAADADAFSVLRKPVPRHELVCIVSTALVTAYEKQLVVNEPALVKESGFVKDKGLVTDPSALTDIVTEAAIPPRNRELPR
ncbi:MAG: response regulator [Planctomyces sp.]|nr:response regulator [Planctomyces sp.]